MLFGTWLEETLDLQRTVYDTNPPGLTGRERAEYIRTNVLAATDELHEFLGEIQWKPWANEEGDIPHRDAAVIEIVDALHFVGNLLTMLNVTDEELSAVYQLKMHENWQRQAQAGGYDG